MNRQQRREQVRAEQRSPVIESKQLEVIERTFTGTAPRLGREMNLAIETAFGNDLPAWLTKAMDRADKRKAEGQRPAVFAGYRTTNEAEGRALLVVDVTDVVDADMLADFPPDVQHLAVAAAAKARKSRQDRLDALNLADDDA